MELPTTPEEPTSVIRIMKDFNDGFITGGRSRRTLGRNRSGRFLDLESVNFSLNQSSEESIAEKEKNRKKDVEILTSKSKIINLENQLKSMETDRKRIRIEQEKEYSAGQRKVMKIDDEKQDLQKQMKYLLDKEESARLEIGNLKKKLDALNKKYSRDVELLKQEKIKYIKEIEEFKDYHRQEMNSVRERLDENELIFFKNKAEENEAQLALLRSKVTRQLNVMKENEELLTKLREAEQKWKSAEEKILQHEEAFTVAKAMQNRLTKLNEIERENEKFKEENKLLRDSRDNAMLLQEKYDSVKSFYEAAVKEIKNLSKLQIENEELKKKINRWEVEEMAGGTSKARSPIELTRMISDLQKSQLSLMAKQGDLQASVRIKDNLIKSNKDKYEELAEQFLELKERENQQSEKCQRLQRRLLLVTADRDGIRRILNNYDTEISPNHSQQLITRTQEAEDRLTAANELIDKMESESDQQKKEIGKYRLMSSKLQAEMENLKSRPLVTEKEAMENSDLKTQIAALKKDNEELQEKVDILEARIERRNLQGHFDPTKTKVLHLAKNPHAISRKLHTEEIDNLRDENEELRRKVKAFEKQGAVTGSSTILDDKEIQELKSKLESAELQYKRLKEVFQNSVHTFREGVYQLYGYKHDMVGNNMNKFKLLSMYAESPDDFFLFENTPEDEMQMIETEFSKQCKDAIDTYLRRGSSIPAFLSSMTLELFCNQTHIIDTTLSKIVKKI
eukprot:Seg904.5 transcript_id=Seg904.5/GoldUCD/mRNA.D3Y31 product="Mitotic spindle assembly checkpoint protein MAD1" protein_id=Seg904.5/GoldUCD/D3Y31